LIFEQQGNIMFINVLARVLGNRVSIPTTKEVTKELKAWKKNTDSNIVRRATDVLERLEVLTKESEFEANLLANELQSIIIKPVNEADYKPEFINTLYKAIQLVGFICPRNQTEHAKVIDPITLEEIQLINLFISCDRYQFSKTDLIRWNENQPVDRNPVTRQVFNVFDQRVLTATRERAQNSVQGRMSRFMLDCRSRFFSNRPHAREAAPSPLEDISTMMMNNNPAMLMMVGMPPILFFVPSQVQPGHQQHNNSTARYFR